MLKDPIQPEFAKKRLKTESLPTKNLLLLSKIRIKKQKSYYKFSLNCRKFHGYNSDKINFTEKS